VKGLLGKLIGFVLLAGFVFGMFAVAVAPFEMFKKARRESWPSRKAVVTKSYASHRRGGGSLRHGSSMYWAVEVCGVYKDNGEKFCAARIRYGGFRWGEGKADAFDAVARYPVGREIDVYYSPDDPKETVLEAASSWAEMVTLLGLGIAFLLLPLFLWLFRMHRARHERRTD
jgi:uncharacterized membrane protein